MKLSTLPALLSILDRVTSHIDNIHSTKAKIRLKLSTLQTQFMMLD